MFRAISRTSIRQAIMPGSLARNTLVPLALRNKNRGATKGTYYGTLLAATAATMTLTIPCSHEKTSECAGIIGVVGGPTCDAR